MRLVHVAADQLLLDLVGLPGDGREHAADVQRGDGLGQLVRLQDDHFGRADLLDGEGPVQRAGVVAQQIGGVLLDVRAADRPVVDRGVAGRIGLAELDVDHLLPQRADGHGDLHRAGRLGDGIAGGGGHGADHRRGIGGCRGQAGEVRPDRDAGGGRAGGRGPRRPATPAPPAIACWIMPGIIMPKPAPMPMPMAPPAMPPPPPCSASLVMLLAAWNFMKAFRSPTAPIALRASMAFCTSSGGVMALMKKSTSSRPYLANSSATFARVPAATSSYFAGRSSRPIFSVPSRSASRATIRSRRYELTASVVYLPCVPTSVLISSGESATRNEYLPKLRSRTMPNSASRKAIGCKVPHFWSMNVCLPMK